MTSIRSRAEATAAPWHRRAIGLTFWGVAIVLGLIRFWTTRHAMNPDGISYLDMADAYLRGDWNTAINAYWSPLYSWLVALVQLVLKPSRYSEAMAVHFLNFLIYLTVLGAFRFFWTSFLNNQAIEESELSHQDMKGLPAWTLDILGHTLCLWSALHLIGVSSVTPDLVVAGWVYLACGLLVRIRSRPDSWILFGFLGLVLGLAYMTKAVMFPLAFVFLGAGLLATGTLRATPRFLLGIIIFLLATSPLALAISAKMGRVTYTETGRLNYAWYNNGVRQFVGWQGGPSGNGSPVHPPRRLFEGPAVYEFATPVRGTYPLWYDPSYWHEGLEVRFDLPGQVRTLATSSLAYFDLFFLRQSHLVAGFLLLVCFAPSYFFRGLRTNLYLLVPAMVAFSVYALVYVDDRLVGAFVVPFWAACLAAIRLPAGTPMKRVAIAVSVAMTLLFFLQLFGLAGRDLLAASSKTEHVHWIVSQALLRSGVRQGDKVANIGYTFGAYWARLAKVTIVAELPVEDEADFWIVGRETRKQIIQQFGRAGARAIIAQKVPASIVEEGWHRLDDTDHYAFLIEPAATP